MRPLCPNCLEIECECRGLAIGPLRVEMTSNHEEDDRWLSSGFTEHGEARNGDWLALAEMIKGALNEDELSAAALRYRILDAKGEVLWTS